MADWTIRSRLIFLVAFMAASLLLVGGLGLYSQRNAEADLAYIYEKEVVPMREVARIRRLVVDNGGQMFRAMQHNPGIEYSKLHDHPVAEHLDVVKKNLAWMEETFQSLQRNLPADSQEKALMKEIETVYGAYVKDVLNPVMAALSAGNYSLEVAGGFLKGNRAFEKQFNPLMRNMAETQEKAVKQNYEHALAVNARITQFSVLAIVLAVVCGLILATMIIRSVTGPLNEMKGVLVRAADGDFTGTVHVLSRDEVGVAAEAFNSLMASLRQVLGEIKQATTRMDESAAGLATAAQQAATASDDTSNSASSMAASVEELSVSITSVSDSTREALSVARTAGEHSESGGAVIASAVRDMADIATQVRGVGETITVLGEHSNKISSVVQVIKDVADQTNLLALNAAIEAARAGEAGRGFAVVADEVRKLAERTTQATGEIAQMIAAIQGSAQSAVAEMDTTMDRLQRGSELAAQAGSAIVAIQEGNNRVLEVVNEINNAMSEQGAASQDIAQRVERVAQASEESSTSVGVSADAAREIYQLSMQMRQGVERFRV